jgi:hypothetical protein
MARPAWRAHPIHAPFFTDEFDQKGTAYFQERGFEVVHVSHMKPPVEVPDPNTGAAASPAQIYEWVRSNVLSSAQGTRCARLARKSESAATVSCCRADSPTPASARSDHGHQTAIPIGDHLWSPPTLGRDLQHIRALAGSCGHPEVAWRALSDRRTLRDKTTSLALQAGIIDLWGNCRQARSRCSSVTSRARQRY